MRTAHQHYFSSVAREGTSARNSRSLILRSRFQISPADMIVDQRAQRYVHVPDQQDNFPLELYLNGGEDLSDLNIGDFGAPAAPPSASGGVKRKRTAGPMDEIKCDPSAFMNATTNVDDRGPTSGGIIASAIGGAQGAQPLMSASSTNSSMNAEHEPSFDDWDECGGCSAGSGVPQRSLRFTPFNPQSWASLLDAAREPLSQLPIVVMADKGFSYSPPESCFINQKKNHFQITVLVKPSGENPAAFVYSPEIGVKVSRQKYFDPHFCV